MIVVRNLSTIKTLQINDLGNTLTYGIDGIMAQSQMVEPGATIMLVETDEVKNSVLTGDIYKFVNQGLATIVSGTVLVTKQVSMVGVAATHTLGLLDVQSVVSVLAFTTATGAPAAKTLLAPTVDYTVAHGDITCVTDQSAHTLVITYLTF